METSPKPDRTLGQTLVGIAHSPYSKPEFLLEGIGPARFRAHYLTLANGLVLDLFTAELLVTSLPVDVTPGETFGIAPADLLGRRLVGVARDDGFSTVILLDGGLFLKDGNDGCTGNPLIAGRLAEWYSQAGLQEFLDYWSEQPLWSAVERDGGSLDRIGGNPGLLLG